MVELNYKTFGQGKPVVFLHGLFGMLDNWQTFGKMIANEGYMVYLVDQRDHGKSPFTEEFSYEILAEDLKQFLESHWLYDSILVGHSMGGKTVMKLADEYPELIDKMVVVDIAPKTYQGGHSAIFEALMSIDLDWTESRNEVMEHLRSHLNEGDAVIQFLLKNLQRKKEGGYRWKMNVELLHQFYLNILGNDLVSKDIDVETLFVRGGDSNYIQEEDWGMIKKTFSQSTLQTVEGAGHWVHAQKPQELFRLIMEFIKE